MHTHLADQTDITGCRGDNHSGCSDTNGARHKIAGKHSRAEQTRLYSFLATARLSACTEWLATGRRQSVGHAGIEVRHELSTVG